ncbi:hypothetical protein CHS0354_024827 [Potamilus streckersoni]|uniref:Uncharacterized protein n=1 Tax=Potamilus streckersoni TaxID=2493646 RepID=A0AAE0SZZ6_9BIVA|nr:hypothetical protein CHS0354_024827 [Potamilus streckersoni]
MAHMEHGVEGNSGRMSRNLDPEMYPMHGYHGGRPQDYNVSVLPGHNREPRYGEETVTNNVSMMPRAHLMPHPQERATYGDNEYRHQGDYSNVVEGLGYPAKKYGVPRMTSSQSTVNDVITSQQEANSGQVTPSGQWMTPTTASGPNTNDVDLLWQSKGWLIFKRVLSIAFMITDIVLAWEQVNEMDIIGLYELYYIKKTITSCPQAQPVIVTYKVLMSFCTIFTIAQIINVIGETVYDATEGQHGVQFIHGFNEVVIKTFLKDIPQLLLMFIAVFFKCTCTISVHRWFLFTAVTMVPMFSNCVRQVTCKQEVKDMCKCDCSNIKCSGTEEETGCACPYLCCYLPIRTKLFKSCVPDPSKTKPTPSSGRADNLWSPTSTEMASPLNHPHGFWLSLPQRAQSVQSFLPLLQILSTFSVSTRLHSRLQNT